MRWLIAIALCVFATSSTADAQAFKPRGGAKSAAKTPAKKATPAKKSSAPKKAKPAKKTSRAAQSTGRTDDLTPDDEPVAKKSSGNAEDDDDYVLIEDD